MICGAHNCNNHGSCVTQEHLYDFYTPAATVGAYTSYDGKTHSMCVCDIGYTGADCSMRMCPKGDDPLTTSVDFKTIQITQTSTSGALTGELKFNFNGESFSFPVVGWTESKCTDAFEELRNVDRVRCKINQHANGRTNNYDITVNFLSFPTLPYENNVLINDGKGSNSALSYHAMSCRIIVILSCSYVHTYH